MCDCEKDHTISWDSLKRCLETEDFEDEGLYEPDEEE